MMKMAVPFLLDKPESGGLGISTVQESFIYGTIGMVFSLIGGIAASYVVQTRNQAMPASCGDYSERCNSVVSGACQCSDPAWKWWHA